MQIPEGFESDSCAVNVLGFFCDFVLFKAKLWLDVISVSFFSQALEFQHVHLHRRRRLRGSVSPAVPVSANYQLIGHNNPKNNNIDRVA